MDNFINGITLLGIPAIMLVPVIVQGLKSLGLPTRWAGAAALAVGLAVAGLVEAVQVWPSVTPFVRFVIAGLLLGFASAGTYSQYRYVRGRDQVAELDQGSTR
jgi:hypothetical protein